MGIPIRWRVCPRCGYRRQGPPGITHEASDHGQVEMLPGVGPDPARSLEELDSEVNRLSPQLRRTDWEHGGEGPIVVLLATAERTLEQLAGYRGPNPERAKALEQTLREVRERFQRER